MNNLEQAPRLSLGAALRNYWLHLVPLTFLPTVMICGIGFSQSAWAFWLMVPLFYGCFYYAIIPLKKKQAPYSFWLLACGLWVVAIFPAATIFFALKSIFKI